jgi:hypothetical protein
MGQLKNDPLPVSASSDSLAWGPRHARLSRGGDGIAGLYADVIALAMKSEFGEAAPDPRLSALIRGKEFWNLRNGSLGLLAHIQQHADAGQHHEQA